jgi:sigma-B regulation protein RsbU (phosphoserine phosphatase)
MAADTAFRRALLLAFGLLAVLVVADLLMPPSVVLSPLFALAPLLACAYLPGAATALVGAAAVAAVLFTGAVTGATTETQHWVRVVDVALVSAAAVAIAAVRVRRERRLARMTHIAEVAQRAILPTLPTATERVSVASRYVSAARDAMVGGDLYDCSLVGHRIRFLVGDVRGKGVAAVEQAARVIRAFRQAAALYADIDTVAEDMNSYLVPFFDDEEFVTGLLVDVTDPERVTLTSCGHPPAVLVPRVGPPRYVEARTGLPLGLGIDMVPYGTVTLPWSPGDRLLMYTDGLAEARDAEGEFLPLLDAASVLRDGTPEEALDGLLARLREHVPGGRLGDDLALVLLENTPVGSPAGKAFSDDHRQSEPLADGGFVAEMS